MVYPFGNFEKDPDVEVEFEMNERHQQIFDLLDKKRDLPVYIQFMNEHVSSDEQILEIQSYIEKNYCIYDNCLTVYSQRNQVHNDVWYEYFLEIENIK